MGMLKQATRRATRRQAQDKKKGTIWSVEDSSAAESLGPFIDATHKIKNLKTKKEEPERLLKDFGTDMLIEHVAETGELPPTPVYITNEEGESVTWVAQDRSASQAISPEQKEELMELLGEEEGKELLRTRVSFQFNSDVLARRGATSVVDKYLAMMTRELREKEIVKPDEDLVRANICETFKPGTLKRLADICGRSTARIRRMIEIMGSGMTASLKC